MRGGAVGEGVLAIAHIGDERTGSGTDDCGWGRIEMAQLDESEQDQIMKTGCDAANQNVAKNC